MSFFTSRGPSAVQLQVLTLIACAAVFLLNCAILGVSGFALVGNRALRLELATMATRVAALEAVQARPVQPPPATELK